MYTQKEERHERWRKINADWEKSGLTQRAYCSLHGLNLRHFETWRHRLQKREPASLPVQVVALNNPVSLSSVFSLSSMPHSTGVHIRYGTFHVDLDNGFCPETLSQALAVLRTV